METLLEAADLAFAYDGRAVWEGVGFTLRAGEFVALVGPNGSGKSTLLRVLLGLQRPRAGRVALGGRPLAGLARREIARQAALVPQESPVDVPFPVREIVAMGRNPHLGRFQPETPEDERLILWAMEATATTAFADRPLHELSGGERQRVMLARALAQQTSVLLLDEPTASLDLHHQLEIMALIRKLAGAGRCALAALHDLNLAARYCDRLILLAGGGVAADGTPESVLTSEHLARHFKIRAQVERRPGTGGLSVLPLEPLPPQGDVP